MEISSPGVSLPGFLAASCLFLIVLSSLSLEIADWLELIVLLTGFAIILVELFLLPTFGVLGAVGIVLFLAGLLGMLLPNLREVSFEYDTHTLNAAGQYLMRRLAWLCGAFLLSLGVIVFLGRYVLPGFSGFRRFMLVGHEQEAAQGFIAGENPLDLPQAGTPGTVFSSLRPSGKIRVEERIYDAVSMGDFIEAGEPIFVDRLDGSVIVVRRKEDGER